jgi:dTDP-4-dehydrorhamnose 3,5-epimerase
MLEPFQTDTPVFKDHRGCFAPIQLYGDWVQTNISINDNIFTFRGLHFQTGEFAQRKKLTVIRGSLIDFCMDLRPETYGNVYQFYLNPGQSVFVPNHFAHGFLTLKSGTIVNYLVDAPYSKIHELSIDYRSVPDVVETIDKYMAGWEIELTISDKDIKGLTLKEYEQTIRY